jgi:hypothetical protein
MPDLRKGSNMKKKIYLIITTLIIIIIIFSIILYSEYFEDKKNNESVVTFYLIHIYNETEILNNDIELWIDNKFVYNTSKVSYPTDFPSIIPYDTFKKEITNEDHKIKIIYRNIKPGNSTISDSTKITVKKDFYLQIFVDKNLNVEFKRMDEPIKLK